MSCSGPEVSPVALLRAALAALLSLTLATSPAFAQGSGNDDDEGGLFDSLDSDSGDSDSGDSDSDSGDSDSDGREVLLIVGLVTLVAISASESNDKKKKRRATRSAAEAMDRLRKAEGVLEDSAARQSPLTVVGKRPADSREEFLTPHQRRQALIVTASTPNGEQLALTVDRDSADLVLGATLFVHSLEAGWQVTGAGTVLSFVPSSQLLDLTGHRPLKAKSSPP